MPDRHAHMSDRWQEWEPWMAKIAHATNDPAQTLFFLKARHARRLSDLLAAGISWRTIRQMRLDHPTISEEWFEDGLREAKRRRYDKQSSTARRRG